MANTEYNLGLGVKVLDTNIQQQIDNISKTLKDINIKIDSKDIEKLSVVFSEVTKDSKKLQTINAQLKNEQGQILKITQSFDAETQQVLNSTTRLLQVRKSETQQLKEQAQLTKLQSDKNILDNRISGYLRENTKLTDDLKNRLIDVQSQISKADKITLDKLKGEFREITTEVKSLGLEGRNFGDELKNSFMKVVNWMGATTIFFATVRTFKNIVEEVKNIDSSMISLKKVTDETDITYNRFLTNAAQKAKELGASISDLVESTADFARLGYSLPDASKLAEIATLYKNVGDGLSIGDASSSIVSTMKAFNITAEDSITIVDKFNEVGNNFSISSAGIGEALKRSASSLVEAGNTLDEAIALVVSANNVIQNPEIVGTMWKTVSMRIRGAKTELEETGLEIDGMVDSTSKLRDEIKALTGGFDIMIDNDTFKSTYDIILGISKVYDKMTDTSQANLLEMLAGKRQANALAAAINNVEDLQKALETSEQSAGSALKEQEKYTKGIEYSLERLKASFQELSMTTIDSSSIKFFVDLANGVVNLTTAMGGLGNVAITLGVAFGAYKILLPILVKQMSALAVANGAASFTTISQAVAQTGLNGAISLGTTAIWGNIAALKAWMASSPVGWLLLIGGATVGLIAHLNSLEKSFETIKQEWDDLQVEISNTENELKNVSTRIDELLNKDSLTIIEQDELKKLQDINTELERQNALLKKQREFLKADFAKEVYQKYLDEFSIDKVLSQAVSQDVGINIFESITKNIDLARFDELEKKKRISIKLTEDEEKEYTKLGEKLSTIAVRLKELADEYPFEDDVKQNWLDMYDIINKVMNPALYKQEDFDKIFNSDKFKKVKDELLSYAEAGKLSPEILYYNKKYEELLQETGLTAHEAASYINSMVEKVEDGEVPVVSFSKSFDTLNKSLDELDKKSKDTVSSIKELNQVLYDQSQGTKLTSEQAYKLITQYPQLASALEKTTDGYVINEEAIENVRLALIEQEKANATAQLNMTKDTLNAVKDRVEAYGIELEAITSLSSALAEQNKLSLNKTFGTMEGWSFDDASKRITTPTGSFIANATATEYDSIKKAYKEQKLINDTIGKMGSLQDRIKGLQNDLLSDKGFGVNKGKGGSDKGKSSDPIKEAFDKKKAEIDHLLAMDKITQQDYLNRLEKLNNEYFGKNKAKYLDQYRKYVEEVYKGRKKIDSDNIKAKFDDLSHSFAMGNIKTEEDYQKKRWELAKKYYKNNKDYLDEWKKAQEEWYKWNLEQAEETAKKQEKIAENLKDKYTDLIGDIADEIKNEKDDVLDSLEESHKSTIKNLEEQKDSYKEIVKTQLDLLDAKKKQNDYEKSITKQTKEISKIESRKAELEKAAKSGDRQALAELSKLDEELAKKKEDLLDEQSDHEYDLQKESLNNALDLNDKLMNAKIDAEKSRFETQKSNIQKLYDQEIELINKAAQYTREEFGKALDEIATQLASAGVTQSPSYLGSVKQAQSGIANTQIDPSTSNRSAILAILRNGTGKDYGEDASALASYTRDNYGAPISKAQAVEVAKLLNVSGINSVSDLTGNDKNKNKILEALRKAGFKSGDGTIALDDKMIRAAGENRIVLGRVGEGLFSKEKVKAIQELTKAMPSINDMIKFNKPNLSNITTNNSPTFKFDNMIQINGTLTGKDASTQVKSAGDEIIKKIMDTIRVK